MCSRRRFHVSTSLILRLISTSVRMGYECSTPLFMCRLPLFLRIISTFIPRGFHLFYSCIPRVFHVFPRGIHARICFTLYQISACFPRDVGRKFHMFSMCFSRGLASLVYPLSRRGHMTAPQSRQSLEIFFRIYRVGT